MFHGREYVVEQRLPNADIQIKDVATNEYKPVPENELLNSLVEGHLEFLSEGQGNSMLHRQRRRSEIEDLNMLEDNDPRKIEMKRRWAYVKEIMGKQLSKINRNSLLPLIEGVHKAIADHKTMPHWKTVYYEWYMPFINAGKDLRSLTPDYKKCGNTKRKFVGRRKAKGENFSKKEKEIATEVAKIVEDVIDEEYLSEQRLTVQEVWDKLDARIAEENRFRDPDDQLPVPHKCSLYNLVAELDEYEKDKARYGKRFADQKHRCNGQGPRPERPLERVEIDHTTLDLFVVDEETKLPVGRPTLTVAIDKFSRMILGIHVGFEPPGYMAVMLCLHHAIMPKTYLKATFPSLENDWNAYGIPEVVVVDNGPEFYSQDFEDACLQLGTVVSYSPVRLPRYKASVERFFGTQNRRLLHLQPGTTFSSIVDRQDYDPKKHAVITFSALMEMLHIWIVDIYQQSGHRGLKDIPAHVWKEGIKSFPPALPRRREELRILLGHTRRRVVGPSGIELFTLYYNSEELAVLRRKPRGIRSDVTIKYDPRDLSIIYVYDQQKDRYIPVPAVDQEYTKGLSLWQHEVVKNYARQNVKGRLNIDALRRAKKKIQEIVDREWIRSGKTGARSKMARWRGLRQPDYDGTLVMENHEVEQMHGLPKAEDEVTFLSSLSDYSNGVSDVGEAVSQRKNEDCRFNDGDLKLGPAIKGKTRNNKGANKALKELGRSGNKMSQEASENKGDILNPLAGDNDSELDMDGFNANYNLPVMEA